MATKIVELRLLVPTHGTRYSAEVGDRRLIMWRSENTPRDVVTARAGAPLDWGGAVVRGRDYEILSDTQGH